jgi:NADH-quinone oxidoreductase subunit C
MPTLSPTLEKDAVLSTMADHPAVRALVALGEGLISDARLDRGELTLTVVPEGVREAAAALQGAGYNFLEDVTAVDWLPSEPRFQVSYHILSHSLKERVRLRAFVSSADPSIDSITPVWPSANFYEREVFDLFGIRFHGHPNLRRIMMPEDFEHHPLRKDFPVEGYR